MKKPPTTTIRLILEIEVTDPAIDYATAVAVWGPAQSKEEDATYRQALVYEQQLAELLKQEPLLYQQQLINSLIPFLNSLGDMEVREKLEHGEDRTLLNTLVAQLPQEAQAYFFDSSSLAGKGTATKLVEDTQEFTLRRVSVEDASGTILSTDNAPRRKKKRYGRR